MSRVETGYGETGTASWYGNEFHGRRTSSGEIYDMYALTAAHRTLPFQTRVQVDNLDNGKNVVVRINDRGPFVAGRFLDLSYGGATALGLVGPGTARIRLTVVEPGMPSPEAYWLQIGAFQEISNAEGLRAKMAGRFPRAEIFRHDAGGSVFHRVRVGIFPSQEAAREAASRLKREGLGSLVFRADEPPR